MSYSSCSCFCLLDRTIQICVSCFRAVKIWFFEYNSLILTTGCWMTTAGTGELRFIDGNMDSNMYCDILKQKMMPSLQKLFSNITTPNTPPRWQLPCCWSWRWWSGQVCLQTWTLLSTCGASSSGRWRSTMCLTSSSSVMSLWRSGRGCQQQPVQLWWIPCPGGLRQC